MALPGLYAINDMSCKNDLWQYSIHAQLILLICQYKSELYLVLKYILGTGII